MDSIERLIPHFAALTELIPVPVVLLDRENRIRCWNGAFATLGGEPASGFDGRPLVDLLAPECRAPMEAQLSPDSGAVGAVRLARVRLSIGPGTQFLAAPLELLKRGKRIGWLLRLTPDPSHALSDPSLSEVLQREKSQKEKFGALLTVINAVVSSLDLNTILRTIAREARQVIQTDECTVFLVDEQQTLTPVVCEVQSFYEEMMALRLKIGEGITGAVALSGRGEIVNDADADPRAVHVPGTSDERSSMMCVPLLERDKVVGVVTMVRIGTRGFVVEDLELATLFAGQCSAAISNARLYEGMKRAFEEVRETQTQLVQSAKLNALGEMAGGVAHDFNNILAAILGRTQLLMQTVSDEEVLRQLKVIEQAALDGAHTVRRVQEFTRVRQDEHFETLDVNQVLMGVLELTRSAWEAGAKRRGVAVELRVDLRATLPLAGNGSELREVFTNLVLNAVDAMPWGGTLWVSSENAPEGVRVCFRDTGVGMDTQTRERIFDPFFTTKRVKGTGLGLSVAYGIVSRHHGTIQVESEPGAGTHFTLIFPVGRGAEPPQMVAPEGPLPRLRALLVDDEQAVLDVLADLLRAMGQEVTTALGGPAGLEEFSRAPYDVVFSDLGMPDVNGWDLARTVKAERPGTAVVLVTGWGFQLEEGVAQTRGVDLILPKPFSIEEVERALRQVGERASSGRAA